MQSDDVLWERPRGGDAEAFTALFERHATVIYNYCFRRIAGWSAAEDLLSIVFLEAWRRRGKRLPPGKVLPWLYDSEGTEPRSTGCRQRHPSPASTTRPSSA